MGPSSLLEMSTEDLLAELQSTTAEFVEASQWADRAKTRVNQADERWRKVKAEIRRRLKDTDAMRDVSKP